MPAMAAAGRGRLGRDLRRRWPATTRAAGRPSIKESGLPDDIVQALAVGQAGRLGRDDHGLARYHQGRGRPSTRRTASCRPTACWPWPSAGRGRLGRDPRRRPGRYHQGPMAGLQTEEQPACRTTMCGPWPPAATGPSGSGPPAAWPATTRAAEVAGLQYSRMSGLPDDDVRPWPSARTGPSGPGPSAAWPATTRAGGRSSNAKNSRPAETTCRPWPSAGRGRLGRDTRRRPGPLPPGPDGRSSTSRRQAAGRRCAGPGRRQDGAVWVGTRRRRPGPLPPGLMAGLQGEEQPAAGRQCAGPGRRQDGAV